MTRSKKEKKINLRKEREKSHKVTLNALTAENKKYYARDCYSKK
jgi:hypothetical protein